MRILYTSLIIGIVLLAGCKKETTQTPAASTYLLKTVTYTTNPASFTFTDTYTYDSKNRIIEFNAQSQLRDYKYTYDDNNNLTTVLTYQTDNGQLNSKEKFTYSTNQITDDMVDNTNFPLAHWVFTLNDKQQVTLISSDIIQYTYDSNGNITGYVEDGTLKQSDTYTYDNKKHPLSMIGARNVHLMFLTGFGFSTVNNVIRDGIYPGDNSYTYNNAGFPITRSGLNLYGNKVNIVTYSYITK